MRCSRQNPFELDSNQGGRGRVSANSASRGGLASPLRACTSRDSIPLPGRDDGPPYCSHPKTGPSCTRGAGGHDHRTVTVRGVGQILGVLVGAAGVGQGGEHQGKVVPVQPGDRLVRIRRTGVSAGASRGGRSNTTRTGWVGATL